MPAVTLSPSDSIALANCLASTSFGNAFVRLEEGARAVAGRHSLGASVETYQWLLIKRIDVPNKSKTEHGRAMAAGRWRTPMEDFPLNCGVPRRS